MGAGRPKKEIDWQQFEKLCGIQCSLVEIASWFSCSEDTIERACKRHYNEKFADIYRQKQNLGKISLRRKLFETAMTGSVPLLIWLSKQMLGYTEPVKIESKIESNHTFTQDEDKAIAEKMRRMYLKREAFDKGPSGNA